MAAKMAPIDIAGEFVLGFLDGQAVFFGERLADDRPAGTAPGESLFFVVDRDGDGEGSRVATFDDSAGIELERDDGVGVRERREQED